MFMCNATSRRAKLATPTRRLHLDAEMDDLVDPVLQLAARCPVLIQQAKELISLAAQVSHFVIPVAHPSIEVH